MGSFTEPLYESPPRVRGGSYYFSICTFLTTAKPSVYHLQDPPDTGDKRFSYWPISQIVEWPEWVQEKWDPKNKTLANLIIKERTLKGNYVVKDDKGVRYNWEDVCLFMKIEQGILPQ